MDLGLDLDPDRPTPHLHPQFPVPSTQLDARNSDATPLDSHSRRAKNKDFGSCDNDSGENKNMYTQTYAEPPNQRPPLRKLH